MYRALGFAGAPPPFRSAETWRGTVRIPDHGMHDQSCVSQVGNQSKNNARMSGYDAIRAQHHHHHHHQERLVSYMNFEKCSVKFVQ